MGFKLTRKQALGVRTESTQGVAVVPSTTSDYILILDADVKVVTEQLERDYKRSNLDTLPSVTGKRTAEVTFKTELKSSGSVFYPPLQALLRACGLTGSLSAGTSSYTPTSDASPNMLGPGDSCTMEIYKDGLKHIVGGALGSFKITAEAGKFAEIEFAMKGTYTTVTDASNPTPYLYTAQPPIAQLAQLSIQGYTPVDGKIEVDMGNDVQMLDDVNSANGVYGFMITGRKPVGSFDPMAPTVAVQDFFGALVGNTTGTGSFQLSNQYGTVQLLFNSVQYTDVAYADKNGLMTFNVPLRYNGTGNDSVIIKMW